MRRLEFWCGFTATQYADPRPLSPRRERLGIGDLRRSHSRGQNAGRLRRDGAAREQRLIASAPPRAKLRLAGSRARPLFHRRPATRPSSRSCRPPSQCSMRRALPLGRSNATAASRRSSTGWRSSKSDSPSVVSRTRPPPWAGCSERATWSRSRVSTFSATSAAARPC